ncbi:MAG: KGG domain-containing protein [Nitrososphaerota archaeon]
MAQRAVTERRKGRGRGFASMDREKQREIASRGGRAAHEQGTAHEWNSDEARIAGRKGGSSNHNHKSQE